MAKTKISTFRLKEISRYWFDLSKLSFGSLILKLLEPGSRKLDLTSLLTVAVGLGVMIIFYLLGDKFAKEVKNDQY